MQTTATLKSGPDDGLHEIVLGAARASKQVSEGAVGTVELRAHAQGRLDGEIDIEAEFAHRGERQVIASLEVRIVAKHTPKDLDRSALLEKALERFGGTAVTN